MTIEFETYLNLPVRIRYEYDPDEPENNYDGGPVLHDLTICDTPCPTKLLNAIYEEHKDEIVVLMEDDADDHGLANTAERQERYAYHKRMSIMKEIETRNQERKETA